MEGLWQRTRGKEVDGNSYAINLPQTEPKFCKNHPYTRSLQQKELKFLKKPRNHYQEQTGPKSYIHINEAYSRRNRSSLRNQDITIKRSIYSTLSIITNNNPNPTHETLKTCCWQIWKRWLAKFPKDYFFKTNCCCYCSCCFINCCSCCSWITWISIQFNLIVNGAHCKLQNVLNTEHWTTDVGSSPSSSAELEWIFFSWYFS